MTGSADGIDLSNVKLIDFGLAIQLKDGELATEQAGSPGTSPNPVFTLWVYVCFFNGHVISTRGLFSYYFVEQTPIIFLPTLKHFYSLHFRICCPWSSCRNTLWKTSWYVVTWSNRIHFVRLLLFRTISSLTGWNPYLHFFLWDLRPIVPYNYQTFSTSSLQQTPNGYQPSCCCMFLRAFSSILCTPIHNC